MAQNTLPSQPAQPKPAPAAAKPAPKLLDSLISPAHADDTLPTANPPDDKPTGLATPTLYLQIGAFASRDNAEQLRRKLSAAHMPGIHISESTSKQRPLYRVRIGPLASVAEADRMAGELGRYGIANPRVVVD
jgi:rare lipoprotein A